MIIVILIADKLAEILKRLLIIYIQIADKVQHRQIHQIQRKQQLKQRQEQHYQ